MTKLYNIYILLFIISIFILNYIINRANCVYSNGFSVGINKDKKSNIDCYNYNTYDKILKSHILPDLRNPNRFINGKLDGICIHNKDGIIGAENYNQCNKDKTWCNIHSTVDLNGSNIDIKNAKLKSVDLTNSDLSNANLLDTNLENAILTDVNLENTFLMRANLKGANLKGANLKGANFTYADLTNVTRNNNTDKIICNNVTKFDNKYTKQIKDCNKNRNQSFTHF